MILNKLKTSITDKRNKYFAVTVEYIDFGTIPNKYVEEAFNFAYNMTFGKIGAHRNHRTGGQHQRKKGEIFCNAFQGKLCEFALYAELNEKHKINYPDLDLYELGEWDDYDFIINDYLISVKSTKSFGQLLLLEYHDWDNEGRYIPDDKLFDIIFLIRLGFDIEKIMKQNRILYSDECEYDKLHAIFQNVEFTYDVPRYIRNSELKELIKNEFVIYKDDMLNGKTKMDADNYYCHIANMHSINEVK